VVVLVFKMSSVSTLNFPSLGWSYEVESWCTPRSALPKSNPPLLRHQLLPELQEYWCRQCLREDVRLLFVGWDPFQLNFPLVN
jgi:hypothetical protein